MKRNSDKTRKKIIAATIRILAKMGFRSLGINAISREAGVDKVLIYRYFGGLPELLRETARSSRFWPTAQEIAGIDEDRLKTMDISEISTALIKGRLRELLKRPATQEILRWELIERNELTDQLHFAREAQGWELYRMLPAGISIPPEIDLEAVAAIAVAAVTYLVLRSKTADTIQGVSLHTQQGWERIENAIDMLIHAFFDKYSVKKSREHKE